MDDQPSTPRVGHFTIGPDEKLVGQLALDGRDTYLLLNGEHKFMRGGLPDYIAGSLNDETFVTLLRCIQVRARQGQHDGRAFAQTEVFPHYVLEGPRHLGNEESSIRKTSLFIRDATALFYDFDAFGSVLENPAHIIKQIAATDTRGRPLPIGPNPWIAYFAGQLEIVRVDTSIGTFTARHCPSMPLGGPRGACIKNEIAVTLEFSSPVNFSTYINRTHRLLAFIELLIGRRQPVTRQTITLVGEPSESTLTVHESYGAVLRIDRQDVDRSPQPADLLILPVQYRDEFITVMRAWFDRDEALRDARQEFHSSFVQWNRYDSARLVKAANMFDLLPSTSAPDKVSIPADVSSARDNARELFRSLPPSDEREMILNALGRVGRASLKQRIRARADIVMAIAKQRFPDFNVVLDEAVNCRNHFVHGTKTKVDYSSRGDLLPFLVSTLEFAFATSDLVECGWNAKRFLNEGTTGSHPFGSYKADYREHLEVLTEALAS